MRESSQGTSHPNRATDNAYRRGLFDVLGGRGAWFSAIVILALIALGSLVVLEHDERRSMPDASCAGQSGERCAEAAPTGSGPQALLRQRPR